MKTLKYFPLFKILKVIGNVLIVFYLFVAASHQTGLDAWSKARRPIKGEGKVGNEPRLEPCWSMLLIGSLGAM